MPARLRSYEDLSNSITGSLHRSASNPSLSTSLHSDSAPNAAQPNSTPLPSPRLPISISAQCLSSSSPQQTLPIGHTHQFPSHSQTNHTSLPMQHSPITRLKQQSLPIDDSAPDITQLAISFQRFPMNLHGVESLLRTIGPKRKYTTSTSSTASSLSETWSLPRIHPSDTSPSQRAVKRNGREECGVVHSLVHPSRSNHWIQVESWNWFENVSIRMDWQKFPIRSPHESYRKNEIMRNKSITYAIMSNVWNVSCARL